MVKKRHRAFEKYWRNAFTHMGNLEPWQETYKKDLAYRAWLNGRKYEKSRKDV